MTIDLPLRVGLKMVQMIQNDNRNDCYSIENFVKPTEKKLCTCGTFFSTIALSQLRERRAKNEEQSILAQL